MAPRKRSETSAAQAFDRLDPSTRFLYTPHTVTFLVLGGCPTSMLSFSKTVPAPIARVSCCRRRHRLPPRFPSPPPPTGLLALVYFSHPFSPDRRPADPSAGAALGYSNAKMGIWAMVLVYLGGCGRLMRSSACRSLRVSTFARVPHRNWHLPRC